MFLRIPPGASHRTGRQVGCDGERTLTRRVGSWPQGCNDSQSQNGVSLLGTTGGNTEQICLVLLNKDGAFYLPGSLVCLGNDRRLTREAESEGSDIQRIPDIQRIKEKEKEKIDGSL